MMKVSGLFLILASFAGILNIPECGCQKLAAHAEEQGKRAKPAPTSVPGTQEKSGTMNSEIKELAVGGHCTVFESFVFVARDAQTYQALKTLNINLPDHDAEFFNSHAVIAAFLGQRRTGGFAVEITQGADGVVQVAERVPKGMVTMALTTPFKIVTVPVTADRPIALSLDATWKERWRTYRVTSGELIITGGFAGAHEVLGLEGSLLIMRERTLITLTFDLKSRGKRQTRELRDAASGTVTESGRLSLAYLDSHSLSGAIQSPFRVQGQFANDEQDLRLDLATADAPRISDNFTAQGSLQALAIAPRPPNRAITGNE
jgi:hypothetical protein